MNLEKLKTSTAAKIAAWIGITLAAIACPGSIIGIYALGEIGIYNVSENEMWEDAKEAVAEKYAAAAIANMLDQEKYSDAMTLLADKYYRYGIIKADELDGVDLNSEDAYVIKNFEGKVSESNLHTIKFDIDENSDIDVAYSLFDSCGVKRTTAYADEWSSKEISNILYDSSRGIFYYECEDDYYPVPYVEMELETEELQSQWFSFQYDFKEKQYRNLLLPITDESTAETTSATTVTDNVDWTQQEYVNFGMFLDNEEIYRTNILLDGQEIAGKIENLLVVNGINEADVTAYTEYEWDENDTLKVKLSETETYWVVSLLPEKMFVEWGSTSLFAQANTLIHTAYRIRYAIFIVFLLSLVLGITFFVFLVQAAGHRKGTTEITRTWIDKMHGEIYAAIAFTIGILGCYIFFQIGYYMPRQDVLCCMIVLYIGVFWLFLLSILSLAVRIKTKTLWKNTILYSIGNPICNAIRWLLQNSSMIWKAAVCLGCIYIVDLLVTINVVAVGKRGLILWILEKIVIAIVVLLGVVEMKQLKDAGEKLAEGDLNHKVQTEKMRWEFREHGENLNRIGEGISKAVDERMKSERFKTELITNVSHDIKTPLTSIINYVDLLQKEELHNAKAEEFLEVLRRQSDRLKKLIEDLIEASKASSKSLPVHLEKLEAGIFMVQTIGEFEEKAKESNLELQITKPEQTVYILADSRHFWRVIDNLMNNICKYAQPFTRVYVDMEAKNEQVIVTFRNTSKYPLNISSDELMERFVRGDSSRNMEGSGLGLSIAKSLVELMQGTFTLYVDGDLFKVILVFSECV